MDEPPLVLVSLFSFSIEYLDPEIMFEFFEAVEMGHIKPLFVGTMNEALNYEIGFDSTIPTLLGYPALQKGI